MGRLVLIWLNKKVRGNPIYINLSKHILSNTGRRMACGCTIYPPGHCVRVFVIFVNRTSSNARRSWLRMQFIVWFVPSLIGNAIAVSLMGMFLGPIYPIVMNQAGRILPPRLLTGSISWIGGFGQAGSAFMPFVTGALASSKGIQSIQPLCVFRRSWVLILRH